MTTIYCIQRGTETLGIGLLNQILPKIGLKAKDLVFCGALGVVSTPLNGISCSEWLIIKADGIGESVLALALHSYWPLL